MCRSHAAPGTCRPTDWRVRAGRVLASESFVLLLALLYFVLLAPFTPGFASGANLESILTTLLPLLLLAVGQTFVLVGGGIDLSVGSIVAVTSVLGAMTMNAETGWLRGSPWAIPGALALMLAAGAGLGLVNGLAVVVGRMPAFIVTLTSLMFFGGFALWITQSQGIGSLPPRFNALGGNAALALPLAGLAALAAHLLLVRTLFGRWLQALGHNPRAALVSGVPVLPVGVAAYVVSGLYAALAAVLLTGQGETGSPVLGQRLLLDVIAAAVIGGVSLFGGRGTVLGAFFGVVFIKLLDNSLNLLGLSYFVILVVKGSVILAAALLDAGRAGLGAWLARRSPS